MRSCLALELPIPIRKAAMRGVQAFGLILYCSYSHCSVRVTDGNSDSCKGPENC